MSKHNLYNTFKNMVRGALVDNTDVNEYSIDNVINQIRCMPMFKELENEDIEFIRNEIKTELSICLDKGVLIEEQEHKKWFLDRKRTIDLNYWERYKTYLLLDKKFSSNVVNTMDDVLDTLTDLLGDPERELNYNRRGLIIGDVQSGKTANYTGLICKAADAGYKVIVLLTGVIEKLRQQTQSRIDEGFVGMNSDAMMKSSEEGIITGVGKYDSSVIKPIVLTSTSDDFKQQNAKNLNFDLNNINGPVIFVVKKNSAVLKRLNKWFTTFNQNSGKKIDHSLLMIDDESDNASINTKTVENPTTINAQLREMLKKFKKSSYVGFTATPYANIFIDPESEHEMVSEDLFPKDYIYSLNAPSNYIGARNIFTEDGEYKDMLEKIYVNDQDSDSIEYILPLKHKAYTRVNRLPDDMKKAIRAFLLANVIEDLNGNSNNHRSMLINVSRFRGVQGYIKDLVTDYVKELQDSCKIYSKSGKKGLVDKNISDLKETYFEIYPKIDFEWEEVQKSLNYSCASIFVQLFNQDSGQNFRFETYPNGARVIAVGGMSLSRGLTLEGLVISYFYRNSRMYDTLMQMGRWFGYRDGYADVCRIWMSDDSIEWYKYISSATDELRDEIKAYEDSGLTPLDFGLRVRSDITSLIVTASNKMKNADNRECLVSLSGETIETPELYLDNVKNQQNIEEVKRFICNIKEKNFEAINFSKSKNKITYGFKDIPKSEILDLVSQINVSPKNIHFNTKSICRFIKEYKGNELNKWDVVFSTGDSNIKYDLGNGIEGKCNRRKFSIENEGKIIKVSGSKRRIGTSGDGNYGISKEDIAAVKKRTDKLNPSQKEYFRGIKRNPLLIIYLIELGDLVGNASDEIIDIANSIINNMYIGFGIGIPTLDPTIGTKYVRYTLNKVAIQNMFEGEDEWENDDNEDD